MNERELDALLNEHYFDPRNPGGLGGLARLQKSVNADLFKQKKRKLSRNRIKEWLSTQDTYTLHRPAQHRNIPTNKIYVAAKDQQWQMDLSILTSIASENDKYKYLLFVIDVFSRYCWIRPLKDKTGASIIEAVQDIFDKDGRKPAYVNTDQGTEFVNRPFQAFLKKHDIGFFEAIGDNKASMVERLQRTIKEKMWRYFRQNGTYRYIDILQQIVEAYNNSTHRSTGYKPAEVDASNESALWQYAFNPQSDKRKFRKPKLKVGDAVRISSLKQTFTKGYYGNWEAEIFFITKVLTHKKPVTYKVRSHRETEDIRSNFYEQQLQKIKLVKKPKDLIEKIVKRKTIDGKTLLLVKWRGYPAKLNSWIAESYLDQENVIQG